MNKTLAELSEDVITQALPSEDIVVYEVCLKTLTYRALPNRSCPQPILHAYGDASTLAKLLETFHQWRGRIYLALWCEGNYNEFWVHDHQN